MQMSDDGDSIKLIRCELKGTEIAQLNEIQFAQKIRLICPVKFHDTFKPKRKPFGYVFFNSYQDANEFASQINNSSNNNGTQRDLKAFISSTRKRSSNSNTKKIKKRCEVAIGTPYVVDDTLLIPPTLKFNCHCVDKNTAKFHSDILSPLRLSRLPNLLDLKIKFRMAGKKGLRSSVFSRVTPLASFCYYDQVAMKCVYARTCIKRITKGVHEKKYPTLLSENNSSFSWCSPTVAKGWYGITMDCPIISPPEGRLGYRNKCEFAFGFNEESSPEVGYVVGRRDFEPIVAPTFGCLHTPLGMQEICCRMKAIMMSNIPTLQPYSRRNRQGCWRLLLVRWSPQTKTFMVAVQIHTDVTSSQEEHIKRLLIEDLAGANSSSLSQSTDVDRICDAPAIATRHSMLECESTLLTNSILKFTNWNLHRDNKTSSLYLYNGCTISSIYLQKRGEVSDAFNDDEFTHIWGASTLEASICGLTFTVSPSTFLQTNYIMCDLLYDTVLRLIRSDDTDAIQPSTIIDICCGAGTMTLCLARALPNCQFVGIEMQPEAVKDARDSAVRNSLDKKTVFYCGKAEDVLGDVLKDVAERSCKRSTDSDDTFKLQTSDKVLAVVDPPRSGLHPSVVQSIVDFEAIDTLIYVSCNGDSLVENAIDLCKPRTNVMEPLPFKPIRIIPVDMFPHTFHCELVVIFRRLTNNISNLNPLDEANPHENVAV